MFEVNRPRNEGSLVRQCPSISTEMESTWVITKELADVTAAGFKRGLDIPRDGLGGGDGDVRAARGEQ